MISQAVRKQNVLLFLVLLSGCVSESNVTQQQEKPVFAGIGDFVSVNYIGKVDGHVFDTSYEDVAKDDKIPKVSGFQQRSKYFPLEFTVGSRMMVPGFEEALVGMKVGEEKTVTVLPEKGYGFRDESLVTNESRAAVNPRIMQMPLEDFREKTGLEPLVNLPFKFKYWEAEVLNFSNDTVTVLNKPVNGSTVQTGIGPATVTVNETHISLRLMPVINGTVKAPYGPAVVVSIGDDFVTLDYNHPLAGKTLTYKIKLERLRKAEK